MKATTIFSKRFLYALRSLVDQHHVIYPSIPPSGIYFESLVERGFKIIRQPFTTIEPSNPNSPKHDLLVKNARISIKTETGAGTRDAYINITKLCTTERDPWEAEALKQHVMRHLSGYEHMLMLRAVWEEQVIHYQVVDIPMDLLRLIGQANITEVGKRGTRKSIAGDVYRGTDKVFRVHFDGTDGKCQVQRLARGFCQTLFSWDYQVRE